MNNNNNVIHFRTKETQIIIITIIKKMNNNSNNNNNKTTQFHCIGQCEITGRHVQFVQTIIINQTTQQRVPNGFGEADAGEIQVIKTNYYYYYYLYL